MFNHIIQCTMKYSPSYGFWNCVRFYGWLDRKCMKWEKKFLIISAFVYFFFTYHYEANRLDLFVDRKGLVLIKSTILVWGKVTVKNANGPCVFPILVYVTCLVGHTPCHNSLPKYIAWISMNTHNFILIKMKYFNSVSQPVPNYIKRTNIVVVALNSW